ncbi:zinc finger CCCH domain-containing protein 12-like [Andrographis paniculata]|uniref:zinc finger CCCH domain-containing protein 12-like n=1 Tax=Andrographis paniculata TaxID=175694 RepID=UPI0021E8AFB3|nr:zinc finger CCCH domain-containing protein 12-like [Andrographis paniculata]
MLGDQELRRNDALSNSSDSAAEEVQEAMKGLKIGSRDGNGGVDDDRSCTLPLPDRPGEPDCIYFLRTGTCGYGSNCRFNHPSNAGGQQVHELPERDGQPNCEYYLRTGACKYGSTCKYHHPKGRQAYQHPKDSKSDSLIMLNMLGLPMRQGAKPCPYYMRTGSCRFGYACKFDHPHPHPPSPANVLPMVRPMYGSGGSAIAPSSGPLSAGEHSAVPLSQAAYVSNPLHLLPSYMPIYLAPPGWETNPVSEFNLPERPDQPECRYYMNHGTCKYGSECKYHHPREKMLQSAASSLGPFGLPLRPGKPTCWHYTLYGHCKYGPACKFDHPVDGFSYMYNPSTPLLSDPYARSGQHPSMTAAMQSSDNTGSDEKIHAKSVGDSVAAPPSGEQSLDDID